MVVPKMIHFVVVNEFINYVVTVIHLFDACEMLKCEFKWTKAHSPIKVPDMKGFYTYGDEFKTRVL